MAELVSDNLFIPTLILGILGWLVPIGLSKRMNEGLKPLVLLAFLATFIMFLIASGFFFILYLFQGASSSALGQFGFFENLFFFGRLGLSSAIIWAPIMVLSVMNRPRHWTKETW